MLGLKRSAFVRYIGVDYSGAATPVTPLTGIRVYLADGDAEAEEVQSGLWTRAGVAQWLVARLSEGVATAVGIDHGFSFPIQYFERYELAPDWAGFLEDFYNHWPTDEANTTVQSVRLGLRGMGSARSGDARWRRITERRCRAKSVFHFDVPGSVAKSTHAGLPWLRFIRNSIGESIGQSAHFWPFDGFSVPLGASLVAEGYPSLYRKTLGSRYFPQPKQTADQHDAYLLASWLQQCDRDHTLDTFLHLDIGPELHPTVRAEGWILGVR